MREIEVTNATESELRDALDGEGLITVSVSEPDGEGLITVSVPDDVDGVRVDDTLRRVVDARRESVTFYREYAALLQSDGTNPPDATVLHNSLGGDVVWGYNSEGSYQAVSTGAFPPARTVFAVGQYQYLSAPYADNVIMRMEVDPSGDSFLLDTKTASDGTPVDGYLAATLIVVRVYDI